MELTDEQLYMLLDCDVWIVTNLCGPRYERVRAELVRLELLSYDKLDPREYRHPSETHVWRLTKLGSKMLAENRVHALELLLGSNMVGAARKHFKKLSLEETPPLLAHSNGYIRMCAKERMKELLDGTDR